MDLGVVSFYRYFPISRRDKRWGLYATTAGESHIPPHTKYPPCEHPEGFAFDWQHGRVLDGLALVYISSGRGIFESKPGVTVETVPIEAGDVFLLFPNVWHRYKPDPKTGWNEHWIGFDGDIARRWLRSRFLSQRNPVLKIKAEGTVLTIFSHVMQSIRANRPALQQILAGAATILMGLAYSAQQAQPAAGGQNSNVVELAIARIQTEFDSDLDMMLLAQELGVGYSSFRHSFTVHTGLSPHQYLLEFRLARARNLLMETELPVKEIAAQTGFEDEHYFSRLFRQKLNCAPGQWRSRNRRHK